MAASGERHPTDRATGVPTGADPGRPTPGPVSDAKRRVVELLKRLGSASAPELAAELALTDVAVRQHLGALAESGLVEATSGAAAGPGRPAARWRLTAVAHGLFPDRHADLTVELIGALRRAVGEDGLDRVIDVRAEDQLEAYRRVVPSQGPLVERVAALARQRTAEGYMAEAIVADDSSVVLVENHCPVCEAATACTGLCRSELEVFGRALGDDVEVTREQHLLSGDQRCAYRVRPRTFTPPGAR